MPDTLCPSLSGCRLRKLIPVCRAVVAACLGAGLCTGSTTAVAQRYTPTATKRADLQIGGGYAFASPDYSNQRFSGVTGYAVLDVSPHFGVEFDIHQANTHGDDHIYERTYELGARYVRHYWRLNPYVRASYGRGVFNFPNDSANLAYNLFAGSIGVDVRVKPHINVRGEFEAQHWFKFQNQTLQPDVTTIGVAYHF